MKTLLYCSCKALGSFEFGMTPKEVVAVMDEEPSQIVNSSFNADTKTFYYTDMSMVYENDKLVEINVIPAKIAVAFTNEIISGPNKTVDTVQFLKEQSNDCIEQVGFLIFNELCIAISGLHDNDSSQENISLFIKGRWDKWLE